jgi:hypothetical protein
VEIVNDTKGTNLTVPYVRQQLDLIYKAEPNEVLTKAELKYTFISFFEMFIQDCRAGKGVLPSGKIKVGVTVKCD